MRIYSRALLAVLVATQQASFALAQTIDPSCYESAVKLGVVCPGEETDPATAVNDPSTFVWRVFAQINQPAFPGNKLDTRRVWETWKSADNNTNPSDAIYLDNGRAPRPWSVQPLAAPPPKQLVTNQQLAMLRAQSTDAKTVLTPFFVPNDPLSEEVRTNRPAFNFILSNQLFNLQGLYQFASVNHSFDFPVASKEVKAVWLEAGSGVNISDYYSASTGGKTYVLVAMHVITKDTPFWVWSSFVHKDRNKSPANGYVAPLAENQRAPSSLNSTPFVNYRLLAELTQTANGKLVTTGKGAQLDWIARTGEPTVVGNPHIESGFETRSSCITCHAHASVGLQNDGRVTFNTFPLKVGAIDPKDFQIGGVIFHPVDFLWSLRQAKELK